MGQGDFHVKEDIQSKRHDSLFPGWHTSPPRLVILLSACSRDCTRATQSGKIPLSRLHRLLDTVAHGIWHHDE